jgi:hypothetical protein
LKPRIRSGFFLDRINAARIKDALNEQVKKINNGIDAEFKYEVKFINGAISLPLSLDEILNEENDGRRRITRLQMSATATPPERGTAAVHLSDVSQASSIYEVPISYFVKSDDQDWAFVTASTIDERLDRIKTTWVTRFIGEIGSTSSWTYVTSVAILVGMGAAVSLIVPNRVTNISNLDAVKQKYSGDVVEFIYQIELLRLDQQSVARVFPYIFALSVLLVILATFLVRPLSKWLPRYTFYWGDNVRRYDRKMAAIKYVASAILVTGMVGLTVNYLSLRFF